LKPGKTTIETGIIFITAIREKIPLYNKEPDLKRELNLQTLKISFAPALKGD